MLLGGRFILWELFYSSNCRIYKEVNFRDIITRLKAPAQVIQALRDNESCTDTGNSSLREGRTTLSRRGRTDIYCCSTRDTHMPPMKDHLPLAGTVAPSKE